MRAAVVIVLGLVACTKPNPNRCCTDPADCSAHGIPVGTTCGQGLVCRGNQCIAEVCTSSTDCDLSAPFCVAMSCSATCTADEQCPGNGGDPANAHCVGGACVVCRASATDCPASQPVCDMGACRGCRIDGECSSGACDLDTGTCVNETSLVYASPSGTATASCSKTDPCSLTHALAVTDASRPNIKLAPGTYATAAAFSGAFALTVYGPATVGSFSVGGNGGTLRLRDIDNLAFVNCQAAASNLAKPQVDLRRVKIVADFSNSSGIGLAFCDASVADVSISGASTAAAGAALTFDGIGGSGGCTATFDRFVVNGGDPAISAGGTSTLSFTNSIFANQGTASGFAQLATGGAGGESLSFQFSTFYNTTVTCPASGTVIAAFSNSIFLNARTGAPTNTVSGTGCTHSYDLIKPQTATPPGANNLLNMDPRFVNAAAGDFHLMLGSPAIDAADPAATLTTDYDGTTRPQGTARDLGAFEYKP